jgi:uncharacterized protein
LKKGIRGVQKYLTMIWLASDFFLAIHLCCIKLHKKKMDKTSVLKAAIIGFAIIVTAAILSKGLKNRNAGEDMISVTGLGSQDFTSDEIYWSGHYNAHATSAKEAYALINEQSEKVKAFFISKGFSEKDFTISGVSFDKAFKKITVSKEGNFEKNENIPDGYDASQYISFTAKKNPALMEKIESVMNQTSELINSGVEFMPGNAQYTYAELAGLKQTLIERATKDAKERAAKIVNTGDGDLGKLKDASMGVFQITGKGSNDEDSYGGNFDTDSKEKSARITVKLAYELE